ncbi:hypothetical protein F5884DRAFT_784305 [Xylogone sp. PMI_703]|nr:hypothetical protein F5884DRAFT_784305 [Xylogone sp. PMI_703]
MNFGASDIIIVITFARTLYRSCRDAGGEYDEISREVRGLHTVLRHLKYEIEAPESPLNRDRSKWTRQLAPIIADCDHTLRQLDQLIQKYGRLAHSDRSPTSPRVLWEKVRFGSNEMDQLGAIRVKLISHKTSLTLLLDTIQLRQCGDMSNVLESHGDQLDVILDKVDNIAARMGQRSRSTFTTYEDDDKEVWKQFRRELIAEGFSSDVLQQHKDVLRAYIREIDQEGLLDEISPSAKPATAVNAERWLEGVSTAQSEVPPPPFSPSNTGSDDSGKEMLAREENMKFPQSIKDERRRPDLGPPMENSTSRQPSPIPKLITSMEKMPYYLNTDGSDSEYSDDESFGSSATIIKTTDLVKASQALPIMPSGSPVSYKGQGYLDEGPPKPIVYQPRQQLEVDSPSLQPGGIPIPGRSPGASPRLEPRKLAPDQYGNEVPPDAKWTQIKRSLISPEVLEQDGLRYEAYPEFVAILGVLSRKEIERLAARSKVIRQSRARLTYRPPPLKPPRPALQQHLRPDTPSTSESESSGDDRRRHLKHSQSYNEPRTGSRGFRSGYPNPYGVPPEDDEEEDEPSYHSYDERESSRKRHSKSRSREKDRDSKHKETTRKRWRDGLTAAGIGGAAASLLNVLVEAAEGL